MVCQANGQGPAINARGSAKMINRDTLGFIESRE